MGTILVSGITLLGVAVANLDKFSHKTPAPTINRLQIDNNVAAAKEFIEKDRREALNAQRILLQKGKTPLVATAIRGFELFLAGNQDRQEQFNKEMDRMNVGLSTGNLEVIETSRRRLTAIAVEEASNLEDSIIKVDPSITKPATDSKTVDFKDESDLYRLVKRKPTLELKNILPINQDRTIPFSAKTNAVVAPDLLDKNARPLTHSLNLVLDSSSGDTARRQGATPDFEIELRGKYEYVGKSADELYSVGEADAFTMGGNARRSLDKSQEEEAHFLGRRSGLSIDAFQSESPKAADKRSFLDNGGTSSNERGSYSQCPPGKHCFVAKFVF